MSPSVGIVIVTHDSERFLAHTLECVRNQAGVSTVTALVDSGSTNPSYLDPFAADPNTHIVKERNIGFCAGNNRGANQIVDRCEYVLFLNPDCFLTPGCLETLAQRLQTPDLRRVGVATGILHGYDLEQKQPTGLIDSSGIFQKWYGQWYDRLHGQPVSLALGLTREDVPAVCGAFMFCRSQALRETQIGPGQFFPESFFMHKEDIELSLRLRRAGWRAMIFPDVAAYHCRGWKEDRTKMPAWVRRMAARNEMRLAPNNFLQNPFSIKWIYSLAKYGYVTWWERPLPSVKALRETGASGKIG